MAEGKHREFTRISLRLAVKLRMADGTEVSGSAIDVSLNGIRCLTDARPEAGTGCDIVLGFGDDDDGGLMIAGEGHIVRHDEDGVAVAIDSLELESHEHFRNLILYNAVDPDTVAEEFDSHLGLHRYPQGSDEAAG